MPTLDTGDAVLHYETAGSGPPLLLIAGLASDSASWGPAAPSLAKRFTLIMPDNRGAGRTISQGAITIDMMARDCAALLDHLAIARAHVAGHSMGGIIAMTLAASAPAPVDKLVVAASSARQPARAIAIIDTLLALREAGASDEHWLRSFFPWLRAPAFFENKNAVEATIALALAYPYAQSVADMRRQVDALRDLDASALPAAVTAETLLLAGECDLLFSPDDIAGASAALASKTMKILPGAAHSLHWDAPQAFVAAVTDFLVS